MAGPRSPTSPVTAQLILRRWRIISFCYCADIQQRSNERMVVLPQTHSRSFHGVEKLFRLDRMKLFKNIRTYGWAVLPQTKPSCFHGVENSFFFWMVWSFSKTFELMAGLWSSKHSPVLFTVLKNRFVWMFCSRLKTFKFMAGPRSPITLSRPSSFRGVEKALRFDVMRTFTRVQMNCWSCSPKHGPAHLTVWKKLFVWMIWSFFKTFELMAGPCSPKHGSAFHGVERPFRLDVMQLNEHIQIDGWVALPNIPCHGPALFAASKNHFVLLLCRVSTTFKWMEGRVLPNTVQGISRCWKLLFSGCYEVLLKHLNLWLGRAPPNTAQLFSCCWRTILFGCYAAN